MGLLAGLRDPSLARALTAMHADIRADWTVARLAGIAGMSRSAFSAKFGSVVGCAPIEYLIDWRMAVARDALVRRCGALRGAQLPGLARLRDGVQLALQVFTQHAAPRPACG